MRYLALVLCLVTLSAHAFKIEQKQDEFTKASYIRVTGLHAVTDYDFYRKAKARGVPADELRTFLDTINP